MLSLRLAGNFKFKGFTMFYFEPETIEHFTALAKKYGITSEEYKKETATFFMFDYETKDDNELQDAKHALNSKVLSRGGGNR